MVFPKGINLTVPVGFCKRNQLHNLKETIRSLLELKIPLLKNDIKSRPLNCQGTTITSADTDIYPRNVLMNFRTLMFLDGMLFRGYLPIQPRLKMAKESTNNRLAHSIQDCFMEKQKSSEQNTPKEAQFTVRVKFVL